MSHAGIGALPPALHILVIMADTMDADGDGRKMKGRGHRDVTSLEERYNNVRFTELEGGAGPGPTRSVEGWCVFVTGVNEEAQEEDLHEAFAEFGDLKNVYLNLDRQTGFVKGYALIEYNDKKEAQAAIDSMNGAELLEKKLVVDWAFKKDAAKRR
jgi:RNA-binding protein 8A